MKRKDKKTVLVTGASRGIGASIAEEFAKNGYDVIINYNNSKSSAEHIKNKLERKYNINAILIKCDVSSEEEVIKMRDYLLSQSIIIDVLVNNAGIAIDSTIEDKSVANFKKIIDINLIGTFLISKYIGKLMFDNKSGHIINISSTNALDTYYPYSMDYDASKAGVISLTHNFASLYAPYINVNTVAPGWVNTEMNKNLDVDYCNSECQKILVGRFAEPEEIAKVVYFLGSVDSSYINNSIIRVDGGFKC